MHWNIDSIAAPTYALSMELHLTPEQCQHLDQIARSRGKDTASLLVETVDRLFGEDDLYRELIRERTMQADAGVFLEEDEMDARVQAMFQR